VVRHVQSCVQLYLTYHMGSVGNNSGDETRVFFVGKSSVSWTA
jgi:hypothetical protein